MPAVVGPIRRAFELIGVAFLPGEDVRLRPGAPLEVGGDSARIHARQTLRSPANRPLEPLGLNGRSR